MTKEHKEEWLQRKNSRQEEYRAFRSILREIAFDPGSSSTDRITAIQAIFEYDDNNRRLAGYEW